MNMLKKTSMPGVWFITGSAGELLDSVEERLWSNLLLKIEPLKGVVHPLKTTLRRNHAGRTYVKFGLTRKDRNVGPQAAKLLGHSEEIK